MKDSEKIYHTIIAMFGREPLLLEREVLQIFQPYSLHEFSADQVAASISRNLVHFYRVTLLRDYPGSRRGFWSDHSDKLCEHDFLHKASFYLTIEPGNPVISEAETIPYLNYSGSCPEPDKIFPGKYHFMHRMLVRLAKIRFLPESEKAGELYTLSALWYEHLSGITPGENAEAEYILAYAENFLFLHQCRRKNRLVSYLKWGAEYDAYLQKYLQAGLCRKTAKIKAKHDFIAAHPLNDENADDCPGHSNPAIRRYHRAFLDSKS